MSAITPIEEVETKANAAKAASRILAVAGTSAKNAALAAMIDELETHREPLIEANKKDIDAARALGVKENLIDRLTINDKRINDMQDGLRQVISLPDPIGEVMGGFTRPNGLRITKVKTPIGVLGIVYESRPNVTVDAAALAVKSSNAVVLRGGSESVNSNIALAGMLRTALEKAGLPADAVTLIETPDREAVKRLMTLNGVIDCLIPRGGASLIQSVVKNSTVPVIETGAGNCHVYLDSSADEQKALAITINAKTQRTSVCNSAETLLIHKDLLQTLLPIVGKALHEKGVEIRGDESVLKALPYAIRASEEDWYEEYNAMIMALKVVENIDEAIAHINHYGTHHSDAIVTENYQTAEKFTAGVDSAAVYVNSSTRFTDGFEFGFGAEIGISNQKLHARGPMGLAELTTYKYIVRGDGQIRE
jgi:glutamate-5-semialdehyde dehydrogenase